jgi:hypothetical protein
MKSIHIAHSLLLLLLVGALHTQAQQVRISPGLQVVASGSPQLVFQDLGLINDGHFKAANSMVIFTGSLGTLPVSIGGGSSTSFHQLHINQRSGDVQLGNNIRVTGSIHLNNGNLLLNHYTLDLGNSGIIIGERNVSRIMGKSGGAITTTAFLQSPNNVNPGNIGVSITSAANLGKTVITRGFTSPLQGTGASTTYRYFDIVPAFNKNLDATLQFHYLDAELSGNENELTLFTTDGLNWKLSGKDNSNTSGNWLIKGRLGQLNRYTLAGSKAGALHAAKTVQLYPNPVRDKFTVILPATQQQEVVLLLMNQSGQVIERRKVNCREGIYTMEWNMDRYAAGNYHLSFEGLHTRAIKIIKE